jgi:DNA-directed RNA polymerase specialized sigma24 family protein
MSTARLPESRRVLSGEHYAAMTFPEIARALGVSHTAVQATYKRAMRKILSNRAAVEKLRGLMAERDKGPQETVYPEWA